MLSPKNQTLDTLFSLQISQSYLKAILKTPQVLYQIPLLVAALVAADSGKTLFQITEDKILPDDIGDDRSERAVCPEAGWPGAHQETRSPVVRPQPS